MAENSSALRRATDDFSLDIYHQIASKAPVNTNIFLSPLSISSAVLLAYAGSKSETRVEIESALGIQKYFTNNDAAVLEAYEEMLNILVPGKDRTGKKLFELALANKAYINQGFHINPEYSNTITKHLHSEIGEVPFKNDTEKARKEINSWVEQQTNSKIKDLLTPGAVDASTLMVLVNAVYFKANWLNPFEREYTNEADFHDMTGAVSKVQLMSMTGKRYRYLEGDGETFSLPPFQMVEIPYKAKEMSMIVFLPADKMGLGDLEKQLTGETMAQLYEASSDRKVDLWLPRFRLEESYGLVEVLKNLGIRHLFENADLSGIADGLRVSDAIHKAFVEVNEEGTEAAAATAMILAGCCPGMKPEPVAQFRADHPFLFAIRHQFTGIITFLGRLAKI